MESNLELQYVLNDLIQTCRDGQEGYLTAAENIGPDAEAKHLLNALSLQRAKFTGELQTAAREIGNHNPENVSSISGTLHRGWINLKTAVVGHDRRAILEDCERGEEGALAEYRKALGLTLPSNIRDTLDRQYSEIEEALDRVKALREAPVAV